MNKMQWMTIGFALQIAGMAAAGQDPVDRSLLRFSGGERELTLFDGAIAFDSCSHHSPQHTLTAGQMVHPYGQGLVLSIQTTTYYGTCTSHQIFDLQSGDIVQGPITGQDCPVARPGTCPMVTAVADGAYSQALVGLIAFLQPIVLGQGCHPAHPELESLVAYLETIQSASPSAPQTVTKDQVAFAGEVHFDSCSPHSPQYDIQVGQQQHLAGAGLVLSIRLNTYYGRCASYQIFDFDTLTLTNVATYGPDCNGSQAPTWTVLSAGDATYPSEIQKIRDFLRTVVDGQACRDPAPQLSPSLLFLEQILRG